MKDFVTLIINNIWAVNTANALKLASRFTFSGGEYDLHEVFLEIVDRWEEDPQISCVTYKHLEDFGTMPESRIFDLWLFDLRGV